MFDISNDLSTTNPLNFRGFFEGCAEVVYSLYTIQHQV